MRGRPRFTQVDHNLFNSKDLIRLGVLVDLFLLKLLRYSMTNMRQNKNQMVPISLITLPRSYFCIRILSLSPPSPLPSTFPIIGYNGNHPRSYFCKWSAPFHLSLTFPPRSLFWRFAAEGRHDGIIRQGRVCSPYLVIRKGDSVHQPV